MAMVSLDHIFLTLAYCTTPFAGEGALVTVSPTTGHFDIKHRYKLPDGTLGCPVASARMTYMSDPHRRPARTAVSRGRTVHWSWMSAWGRLTMIDLDSGSVAHNAKGSSADLFDGFANFAVGPDGSGVTNVGLSPHVEEDGFCEYGCYRLGVQNVTNGTFRGYTALPFKATSSSVSYHDHAERVYYAQGSHPLTDAARCGTDEASTCLYAINSTTGALLSSRPMPHFQVYSFAEGSEAADGTLLAWGFGFQDVCGKTLDSYAFARVHLPSGTATRLACIDQSAATIHKSPEMGAFSQSDGGARFAFATGDDVETGLRQLLVFNTSSGQLLLNTKLDALPKKLGVSPILPIWGVWGIAHMPLRA